MLKETKRKEIGILMLTIVIIVVIMSIYVAGDPTGAHLTNLSTLAKNVSDPQFDNHSKGPIHTIN